MANELVKWDNEQLELIKQTVAKGATNAELQMFVEFCKSTRLNPFKREIWFIKTPQGVQIMTGIAGFLTIANAHPQYDGMEVSIQEDGGKLISATAKVYRKDRKYPSVATVYLKEYFKPSRTGNGLWEKMPRMMLQKVAKSVALREAFSQELAGLYTAEEMPPEYAAPLAEQKELTDGVIDVESQQAEYWYDITRYGNDKFMKAQAWCERHGVPTEYKEELGRIVAISTFKIKFFDDVEVKHD